MPGELRKTITVVFTDLTGSTTLGERLDPEALRRVMGRYYEEMRYVVERHGGTVHKLIGDAVMAVFGIPRLHEDDALRAVGAAAEMRGALEQLNAELESRWGVRLRLRTGVNTGEVVTGDAGRGEAFIVGDAVNVAARLEQSADPGEILIGEGTYRLVRDLVTAERTEGRLLKGKAEPVTAYRLMELTGGEPSSRLLGSPLVGREPELEALDTAFERAVAERTCRLLTLFGPAGVGKSRLTIEFLNRLDGRARVAHGRCLSYGEGITFWPIGEVVKEAAKIREEDSPEAARDKIRALIGNGDEAALVLEGVAGALGLSPISTHPEETFWAIRKLIEALARDTALIVVFDDIQWAEPTFLDLIEYLASFSSGLPVLVLSMARAELLELRPNWGLAVRNASSLTLRPLGESESRTLIENLLGEAGLEMGVQERIVEASEGNPLFVEEMLRMLVDDGLLRREASRWISTAAILDVSIPPTIQTLLAARLDRLEAKERGVLERAAVVGQEFWPGAVAALSPEGERHEVWARLQSLIRKELIRPGGAPFGGEDAFTFSHILIRDTAYEAMLKETRAGLHEAFALWLERKAGTRLAEYEEILGYHLEQAYRHRKALETTDRQTRALANDAARHLAAAGRRAHSRGDMQAAVKLFERSFDLHPQEGPERLELMLELSHALFEVGELEQAESLLSRIAERAATMKDRRLELRALIARSDLRTWTDPSADLEELRTVAEQAVPILEELGDETGLAKCWRNLATVEFFGCRFGAAEDALERALGHARRAGEQQVEAEILPGLATALYAGPTSVEEAIARLGEILEQAADDPDGERSSALTSLGTRAAVEAWGLAGLEAMRGRFDQARLLCSRAKQVFSDVGQRRRLADVGFYSGLVERLAEEPERAESELRTSFVILEAMGERALLSTVAAELAEVVYLQGRDAEAERLTQQSDELAVAEDVESQVRWRVTRAKVYASRGDLQAGEALAREAIERSSGTESPNLQAGASMALAEVLIASTREAEAADVVTEALELYERKGNLVSAEKARALLEELSG